MSADFTVDDVLRARPSLRTRASDARTAFLADKKQRRYEDFVALCEAAQAWCVDELGVHPVDAAELSFDQQEFNPDTAEAHWMIDGIRFKARFVEETVNSYKKDGETINIREKVPKFEMSNMGVGAAAFKPVKTLVDVGAHL